MSEQEPAPKIRPSFKYVRRAPDGHLRWRRQRMAYWLPDGVTAEQIGVVNVPKPEAVIDEEVPF